MFKKLKDKIAEEVKASPQRVQQLAKSVVQGSSNSDDGMFSIDEEQSDNSQKFSNVSLHPVSTPSYRSRKNSNSSVASDVSFLPSYESPGNLYHLQSDLDVSASEIEDNINTQIDRVSKEQLLQAFKKIQLKYNKYRGRYTDLANHYRILERENAKTKSVLVETQDKALRRVAELKEQCQLEQTEKTHMKNVFREDLNEKLLLIDTLQTKIQLLQNPSDILVDVSEKITNNDKNEFTEKCIENNVLKEQVICLNDTITKKNNEIELMLEREKNNNLLLAENKKALHTELESRDHIIIELKQKIDSLCNKIKIQEEDYIKKEQNDTRNILSIESSEEYQKLKRINFNLENEVERLKTENNKTVEEVKTQMKKKMIDLEIKMQESLAANYANVDKTQIEFEGKLEKLNSKIIESEKTISQYKTQNLEYKNIIEDKNKKIEQIQMDYDKIVILKNNMESDLNSCRNELSFNPELKSCVDKLTNCESQLKEKVILYEQLKYSFDELQEKLDSNVQENGIFKEILQEILSKGKEYVPDMDLNIFDVNNYLKIFGRIQETLSVNTKLHDNCIDLENKLENLNHYSEDLKKKLIIHELEEDKLKEEISKLKEIITQNENITEEMKKKSFQYDVNINLLHEKDKLIANMEQDLQLLKNYENNNTKLCSEIEKMTYEKDSLLQKIKGLEENLKEYTEKYNHYQNMNEELNIENIRISNECKELCMVKSQNDILNSEKEEINDKLCIQQKLLQDYLNRENELINEKDTLLKDKEQLLVEFQSSKVIFEENLDKISIMENQNKKILEENISMAKEKDELCQKLRFTENKLNETLHKLDTYVKKNCEVADIINGLETKLLTYDEKIEELESEIDEKTIELQNSIKKIASLELEIQEINQNANLTNEENNELKIKFSNAEKLMVESKIVNESLKQSLSEVNHNKLETEKKYQEIQISMAAMSPILKDHEGLILQLNKYKSENEIYQNEIMSLCKKNEILNHDIEKFNISHNESSHNMKIWEENEIKLKESINKLKSECKMLQNELEEQKKENLENQERLEELVKHNDILSLKLTKYEDELQKFQSEINELNIIKSEHEEQINVILENTNSLNTLKQEIEKVKYENNEYARENAEKEKMLKTMEMEKLRSLQELSDLQIKYEKNEHSVNLETHINKLSEDNKMLIVEIESINNMRKKILNDLEVEKVNNLQLLEKYNEKQNENDIFLSKINEMQQNMDKMKNSNLNKTEINTEIANNITDAMNSFEMRYKNTLEENLHLKNLLAVAEDEYSQLKNRNNIISLKLAEIEQEKNCLKQEISNLNKNVNKFIQNEVICLDESNKESNLINMNEIERELQDFKMKYTESISEIKELTQKLSLYQNMEQSNKTNLQYYEYELDKLKNKNEKLKSKLDETLVTLNHCAELSSSTEMEYLKNILYNYMIGKESLVLARVIAAVCKFDSVQTDTILQKEYQKQTLLGHLGLL